MKVPFIFSLCVHCTMVVVFVGLTQPTTTETGEDLSLSKISVVSLNSFNALVSKPPIVDEIQRPFHLDENPKIDSGIDIREVSNASNDLNFDTSFEMLDSLVGEKSGTPILDAFRYSLITPIRETYLTSEKFSFSYVDLDDAENAIPNSYTHSNNMNKNFSIKPLAFLENFNEKIPIDSEQLLSETRTLPQIHHYVQGIFEDAIGNIVDEDITTQSLTSNFPIVRTVVRQKVSSGNILESPKKSYDKTLKSTLQDVFIEFSEKGMKKKSENHGADLLQQDQLDQMAKVKSKQFVTKNLVNEKSDLKLWGASIKNEIYSNLRYPYLAVAKKIEGKVTIQLKVTKEGRLKNLKILKSSGFYILDEEVLRATEQAHSFPSAPVSLHRLTYSFSLPIKFEI